MADEYEDIIVAELAEAPVDSVRNLPFDLGRAAVVTGSVVVVLILLLATYQALVIRGSDSGPEGGDSAGSIGIEWGESLYMPRHEECIDEGNGQGLPEFGVGYEPSISITSNGNMFVTAHKDLRWGGQSNPFFPLLGGNPGPWYACQQGQDTTWDYWASWFWASYDNGSTWQHGDNFGPTPGNSFTANYLAGGSECLGDEGDISVDAQDTVYYLDTTLEDNWWHTLADQGTDYDTPMCQRMNTMAADDRPWVAAQSDGIIHYLGNSGASPPECTGDSGRYWYYHSENGGATFTQCYAVPGGWSTVASQRHGPYVYIAQENADTQSGSVIVRVSDDHGRGTGITDGTWSQPIEVGLREGNCPEGYPVVNTNENGTVAVVWADCPNGGTGPWVLRFAISYDHGSNWSTWNISHINGIQMYPFVSISEGDVVSIAFYGLDFDDGELGGDYVEGEQWFLYAGALQYPTEGDSWDFTVADPSPLHTVTAYEQQEGDVHALHDFFETVLSPDGSWIGIAYQQNVGEHPFEDNEEQRYIKFVRGNMSAP